MSSSQQHWFVQTDFGALLGPMPDDALAEMAHTGALLIRDRVREGTDGEWRPAGEVPGLFDEATPQLGLMSSQLEDLFAPQATPTREPAADRRIHRHPESMREDRSPVLSSPEFEFEIDTPLITPPAASPAPIVNQVDLNFDFDVPLMIQLQWSLRRRSFHQLSLCLAMFRSQHFRLRPLLPIRESHRD